MDKNKFKNSLTGAPLIDKPRLGFGRKRIFDAENKIIGTVSGTKIYDLNGRLWGRIITKNEASGFNKNEIVDRGTVIATIDNKKNIYRKETSKYKTEAAPTTYVGTIKSNKTVAIVVPILVATLIITAVTSVILSTILKDNSEDDYLKNAPVLGVYSQADNQSWKQNTHIDIFRSNQYNTAEFIAPGDTGSYAFVVRNENTHAISFAISFREDNEHNFSLRYRLSDQTRYLIGGATTWVSIDNLTTRGIQLLAGATQVFVLEWWWDPNLSDEDDTINGQQQNTYNIEITVTAEFV